MKRLIIFLVRKRLGLKKFEYFQFVGQKTDNVYYFSKKGVIKMIPTNDTFYLYAKDLKGRYKVMPSSVSFNWLLDDECKIRKVDKVA